MKKHEIIPKMMWFPLLLTLICNAIAYNGSRLLTGSRFHYNLSSVLDEQHVLIDVIFGVMISEVSYLLAKKSGFSKWYMNFILTRRLKKGKGQAV